MFDRMKPCGNCPFRKRNGSRFQLRPARLAEIREAQAFQCHKTVDYDDEGSKVGDRPQQCAGLMAVLMRSGSPNAIMQVAMRLGALHPDRLDPEGVAYASWVDVIEAHVNHLEPGEEAPCPVQVS